MTEQVRALSAQQIIAEAGNVNMLEGRPLRLNLFTDEPFARVEVKAEVDEELRESLRPGAPDRGLRIKHGPDPTRA